MKTGEHERKHQEAGSSRLPPHRWTHPPTHTRADRRRCGLNKACFCRAGLNPPFASWAAMRPPRPRLPNKSACVQIIVSSRTLCASSTVPLSRGTPTCLYRKSCDSCWMAARTSPGQRAETTVPLTLSCAPGNPPAGTESRVTAAGWWRRACGTGPAAGSALRWRLCPPQWLLPAWGTGQTAPRSPCAPGGGRVAGGVGT